MTNAYIPHSSRIREIIPHTAIEYTFRMEYADAASVKPGQFFEISLPKFGEAPISVSGIGEDFLDFTIRKVGKVTDEIFTHGVGQSLLLRGPYGNGFDVNDYKGREIIVVAGGTGLSPVRGVIEYFVNHPEECEGLTVIAGFKSPTDILFFDDIARWKKNAEVILTVDCAEDDKICQIGLVTEFIPHLKLKDIENAVGIVVGPPAMMHFSSLGLLQLGIPEERIWVSQERKMCCGLGKCGHCRINDVYVCLDGPVFPYTVGKNLID